jgi:hypothetical protein
VVVRLEEGLEELRVCVEAPGLTCGWLLGEVTRRYAALADRRKRHPHLPRIKKKIIGALKSQHDNESLDLWLTLYNRSLEPLWNDARLEVHFSSKLPEI